MTRTQGEHEIIIQEMEDYEANGYQLPEGEGWTFGTSVNVEGRQVVSVWHRTIEVTEH